MNYEPLGRLTFCVTTKLYESLDSRYFFFTEVMFSDDPRIQKGLHWILYSDLRDARHLLLTAEPFTAEYDSALAISVYNNCSIFLRQWQGKTYLILDYLMKSFKGSKTMQNQSKYLLRRFCETILNDCQKFNLTAVKTGGAGCRGCLDSLEAPSVSRFLPHLKDEGFRDPVLSW